MNMWMRFAGYLGLVLFGFGLIGAWVVEWDWTQPLILSHLVIGSALLITWAVSLSGEGMGAMGRVATGRAARFGLNAGVYIIVFVGLLAVLNWWTVQHEKKWDLTAEGVYSLASQSEQVVERLQKPLKLVAFKGNEAVDDEQAKDLLERYRNQNPSTVTTELVDPRSQPHLVDTYEMKPGNVLYLEYGPEGQKGVSRINELTEEAITNAIIKLTRGEAKRIYYVLGHEEPAIDTAGETNLKSFASAVSDEHLTLEGIFLAEKGAVPDNAAAVILASPKKPLLPGERDMLIQYAEGGGRLVLFTDPRTTDEVRTIAQHFGIEVGQDIIIDQVQRLFAGPALGTQPVAREYGAHEITKGMTERTLTIFNIASSVRPKETEGSAPADATYTELLKTGPSAWAETNLAAIFDSDAPSATLDDADTRGPVSMAVAYEKKISPAAAEESKEPNSSERGFGKAARVVVFGDTDWIMDANFAFAAHRDLVLNTLNWVVGEEGGISIRPRALKAATAPILRQSFLTILITSFLAAELIVVFGLFVWWSRRNIGSPA